MLLHSWRICLSHGKRLSTSLGPCSIQGLARMLAFRNRDLLWGSGKWILLMEWRQALQKRAQASRKEVLLLDFAGRAWLVICRKEDL